MRPVPTWLLTLSVLLCACGTDPRVQLVAGTISSGFPDEVVQVRALRAGALVSAVPVSEDGSFLLPLRAGGPVRFRLMAGPETAVGYIGDPVAAGFYEVEVCAVTSEPIELEHLRFVPERGLGDEPCREAAFDLQECLRTAPAQPGCEAPSHPGCAEACAEPAAALKGCADEVTGDCGIHQAALDTCVSETGCSTESWTCGCFFESVRRGLACPGRLDGSPIAVPSGRAPLRVGCER